MAYAFVQAFTTFSGSLATYTLTKPATAAGAVLPLAIAYASNNRDVNSVTDDVGGIWVRGPISGISTTGMAAYYCTNAPTSAGTITVVFDSTGVSGVFLGGSEYSGLLTAAAIDKSSTVAVQPGGASVTATTAATTQNGELLWTFGRSENTGRPLSAPSGYSAARISLNSAAFMTSDMRQTAIGTTSATWPVSGGNAAIGAILLTFKEIVATGTLSRPSGLDGLSPSGSLNFNPTL